MAVVDPKAGEWKHEILVRMLFAMVAAAIVATANFLINEYWRDWDALRYGLPPVAGFSTCVFEGILRRSWRTGLISAPIGTFACALGFWVPLWMGEERWFGDNCVRLAAASLGAGWGLCAGIGARSLAATVAALLLGQAGGLLGYACFRSSFATLPGAWFCYSKLFLPMAAMIGAGVWLGVRLGRSRSFPRGK